MGRDGPKSTLRRRSGRFPAERMKAAREHRVPLSERALAILERLSEARTGEFVFPGQRGRQAAFRNGDGNGSAADGVEAT